MSVDVNMALSQKKQLSDCAEQIKANSKKVKQNGDRLNLCWSADEMAYINQAISAITMRADKLANHLEKAGNDIYTAAQQIYEEEAARIERERAARRAAEEKAKKASLEAEAEAEEKAMKASIEVAPEGIAASIKRLLSKWF